MKNLRPLFACIVLFLGFAWAAPAASAQDGNVFLIISTNGDGSFVTGGDGFNGEGGSPTIIVNIGTLVGGAPDPRGARFMPASISTIPLPDGFTFDNLADNSATIFGSFETEDLEVTTPHMVTPTATDIDPLIQAATFASSAFLAAAASEDPFMTTGEIAQIVLTQVDQPEGEGADQVTLEEVAEALFDTGVTCSVSSGVCEAEGGLLPHKPGEEEPLFSFEFSFDSDGDFAFDVCLLVDIDVPESAINTTKKGTIPVAILDSDTFDSSEVDASTVAIVGIVEGEEVSVFASKTSLSKNKLICHFSVQELAEAGLLGASTTEITLRAETNDGGCVTGTGAVNVKK